MLHEVDAAIQFLRQDELPRCIKVLNRVKQVQHQLINQWSVLATLTPTEYSAFRDALGSASGFQSPQYRLLEFKLGNKDRALLSRFSHHLEYYRALKHALEQPSLYDEFLRYLYRVGHRVPAERVDRDWTEPYQHHPGVVEVLKIIYEHPDQYWAAYEVSERFVDIEINFQSWRFHHMKTVERIIGSKSGTGGTSGVKFLEQRARHRVLPRADRGSVEDRLSRRADASIESVDGGRLPYFSARVSASVAAHPSAEGFCPVAVRNPSAEGPFAASDTPGMSSIMSSGR